MDKMTAADTKDVVAHAGGTVWDFLSALPGTLDFQIFYTLVIAGVFGVLANYENKWLHDEIVGSPIDYLFRQNLKRTITAFASFVATCFGLLQSNMFINAGVFIGWGPTLLIAVSLGWNFDASINKGQRRILSPEDRKVAVDAAATEVKS